MPKKAALTLFFLLVPATAFAQHQQHPYYAARLAACQGKAAGDACSFQGPNGAVSATCRVNRRSDLICGAFRRH